MDQKYFTNTSYLSVTVPASGMNAKLTYDDNNGLYRIKNITLIVLSGLAIIFVFISTITERMIGV